MSYKRPNGRAGFYEPVIERPDKNDSRLSFNNLLEVYVLRALRTVHEVKLEKVREAIDIASNEHNIQKLLLHDALRVTGKVLFLDKLFELVELSASRQFVIRDALQSSLDRVSKDGLRVSLFPDLRKPAVKDRLISVSPHVAFGSAVIASRGITTSSIVARLDAGEDREAIIADYRLDPDEFDEAIRYERAA